MNLDKPFAPSCENNRQPILDVLLPYLQDVTELLEIGSGTGQHAVYMAQRLPTMRWQTSDLPDQHAGIRAWLDEAALPNVSAPLNLDVVSPSWPLESVAAVYTANTAHIMSWPTVQAMFAGVGRILQPAGLLLIYGPFNYEGQFTSAGNQQFAHTLKMRDPASGLRDFEGMDKLAELSGLTLVEDVAMPANNRLLIWRK